MNRNFFVKRYWRLILCAAIFMPLACAPQTPDNLHEAAESEDSQALQEFIDKAEYIDVRNAEGESPLMAAAFLGNVDNVKLLLEAGADARLTNDNYDTALHEVSWLSNTKSMIKIVDLLIAAGADIEAVNGIDETPLISAIAWGMPRNAEVLIEAGADTNYRDNDGDSLLVYACDPITRKRNAVKLLKLMLKYLPDLSAKNNYGQTALETCESLGASEKALSFLRKQSVN